MSLLFFLFWLTYVSLLLMAGTVRRPRTSLLFPTLILFSTLIGIDTWVPIDRIAQLLNALRDYLPLTWAALIPQDSAQLPTLEYLLRLGLGTLFLALYLVWRTLWLLLAKLLRRSDQSPTLLALLATLPGLRQAAQVMPWLLALLLGLAAFPLVYDLGQLRQQQTGLSGDLVHLRFLFSGFSWLGLLLLLTEITACLREPVTPDLAPPATATPHPQQAPTDLSPVLQDALYHHAPHLLYCEMAEGSPTTPQSANPAPTNWQIEAEPAAAQRLYHCLKHHYALGRETAQRFSTHLSQFLQLDPGHGMVIEQALSLPWIELIAELCQESQDQGRLSLIICPAADVEEVAQSLANRAGAPADQLNQAGAILTPTLNLADNALYPYLIVSDLALDPLFVDHFEQLPPWMKNIGLVVCLNLQDIAATLLRLSMSRLWRLADQQTMRFFAQGDGIGDVATLANGVFVKSRLTLISEGDPHMRKRHLLIWEMNTTLSQDLNQRFFKDPDVSLYSANLLLSGLGWLRGLHTCWIDHQQSYDADHAHMIKQRLHTRVKTQASFSSLAMSAHQHCKASFKAPLPYEQSGQAPSMVTYKDTGDLLLTLQRPGVLSFGQEQLVHILSEAWPLRDFIIAALKQQANSQVFRQSNQRYTTALAPIPRGGVRELVSSLARSLATPQGMKRSEILEEFATLLPKALAKGIGAAPGSIGLAQLFQQVGIHHVVIQRLAGQRTRYTLSHQRANRLRFHLDIREKGDQNQVIATLPRAALGLTLLVGQKCLLQNQRYLVKEAKGDTVYVERGQTDCYPQKIWPDLRYGIKQLNNNRAEQYPAYVSEGEAQHYDWGSRGFLQSAHLHLSFSRLTAGYFAHPQGRTPMQAEHRLSSYLTLAQPHYHHHLYQNVLALRFCFRGQNKVKGKLAFTLGVVLQDVVRALAPYAAPYLLAGCVQSAQTQVNALRYLQNSPSLACDRDAFVAAIYPLIIPKTKGQPPNAPTFHSVLQEVWQDQQPVQGALYELVLFEDSGHDLGVVRALSAKTQLILTWMQSFVAWQAKQPSDQGYYCFGAQQRSALLDFQGLNQLLQTVQPPGSPTIKTDDQGMAMNFPFSRHHLPSKMDHTGVSS